MSMNFHSYTTIFDMANRNSNVGSVDDFYTRLNHRIHPLRNRGEIYSLVYSRSIVESSWYRESRPYYKIWPSILPTFLNLKLDIAANLLKPKSKAILIRFGEGCEPTLPVESQTKVHSALASTFCVDNQIRLFVVFRFDDGDGPFDTSDGSFTIDLTNDKLENLIEREYEKFSDVDNGKFVMRIVATLFLLENDPSIIQPDVLAADRRRFDNSTDPAERQRLIDKARKRGVVGWRIGEQYETIPHFRRPHPALYHVGKGRHEQRIVFRAGAIVHRQKLTEVPTGWLEDDGTEVER